jgi:hypothetical protein
MPSPAARELKGWPMGSQMIQIIIGAADRSPDQPRGETIRTALAGRESPILASVASLHMHPMLPQMPPERLRLWFDLRDGL